MSVSQSRRTPFLLINTFSALSSTTPISLLGWIGQACCKKFKHVFRYTMLLTLRPTPCKPTLRSNNVNVCSTPLVVNPFQATARISKRPSTTSFPKQRMLLRAVNRLYASIQAWCLSALCSPYRGWNYERSEENKNTSSDLPKAEIQELI